MNKTTSLIKMSVLCLTTALFLSSCGSRKAAQHPADTSIVSGNVTLDKMVATVNANRQTEPCMTARMNLTLEAGVKRVSVGGTLKMKRNDVIQLSMVAFGVVEAGRMELAKDYFMIVDRVGHQYIKASYKDIEFFRNAGIDFYTFQSLFWDELFLLGDKGVQPIDAQYEKAVLDDGTVRMTNADSKHIVLTFLAHALSGLVRETRFAPKSSPEETVLAWQYQSFGKLGQHEFPTKMKVTAAMKPAPVEATISLSHLNNNDGWETRTELSSRYKKVAIETIFSRLMSLSF